jgi:hypothetical protein
MKETTTIQLIGLDTHRDSFTIAVARFDNKVQQDVTDARPRFELPEGLVSPSPAEPFHTVSV